MDYLDSIFCALVASCGLLRIEYRGLVLFLLVLIIVWFLTDQCMGAIALLVMRELDQNESIYGSILLWVKKRAIGKCNLCCVI